MTRRLLSGIAALTLLLCGVGQANADPITTLYSTGVDGSGNPLPDGSVDPHYTVTGGALAPNAYAIGNPGGVGWVGNTATSQWISPDPSTYGGLGPFTYTTTFSLAGLNPATAQISGMWSTDDQAQMYLNGNLVVTSPSVFTGPWSYFAPFTITSGFQAGVNTLTFVVPNGTELGAGPQGPTGMQVQMTGTANTVPEPASLTLVGLGALSLAGYGWRRRHKAKATC
jgi:hypothetical protein